VCNILLDITFYASFIGVTWRSSGALAEKWCQSSYYAP
jgi:hypothetical protein